MQTEAIHGSLSAVSGSTGARPSGRETTSERAFGLTIHIRAVAGLLLFSLGLTLALLLWSAKRQDEITIASSRHLAESALGVVSSNLGQTVIDYTYWDDAYKYIAEDFSQVWYEENLAIAEYLNDNFGITSTFVVTPDNQVLRHMHDGQPFPDTEALDLTRHVEGGILALVDRARRYEDGKFRPSTGLLKRGGRPFIAAARIINPHTDERRAQAGVTPENGYITIFLRPLDDELLQSIASDFALDGLRYDTEFAPTGELELPLYQANGQVLGNLTWQIDRPSRHVLSIVLPALLFVIACVGLLSAYVLASLRRGQGRLYDAMLDAQSSDRIKSGFLANMSHELRTPLNAISGFSQAMQAELAGPLTAKQREYLSDIHASGDHLLALINDVLDLSKVELGELELSDELVDVEDCIKTSVGMLNERKHGARLEVETKSGGELPLIRGDSRKIKQILLNLLSNAFKFSGHEDTVVVDSGVTANGWVYFNVSDTGIGMSPDEVEVALSLFGQVDSGMGRNYEGSGLGLPLCKSLVEAHGGNLEIESEPGVGTKVQVIFPPERTLTGTTSSVEKLRQS